jgi:hypothetical protein
LGPSVDFAVEVNVYQFHPKVFTRPYAPYYDAYKDHHFVIDHVAEGDHVWLRCIDGDVAVDGYVELDQLIEVK